MSISTLISKFIPILYNVRNNLTPAPLKHIYNGIIYPNLTYCISIWGTSTKFHLKPLFILQKKLIRIMSFKNRIEHSAPLFKSLFILPLNLMTIYMTCTYVFELLQRGDYAYFAISNCPYGTRRSDAPTLSLPPIMTTHGRQSLLWTGASTWNDLPRELRLVSSWQTFKRELKKYLLSV